MALTLGRESDMIVAARREPPGNSSESASSHRAAAPLTKRVPLGASRQISPSQDLGTSRTQCLIG